MREIPKYIIWTPGRGNTLIHPGQTHVRLTDDYGDSNRVCLVACDSAGEVLDGGYLLFLSSDGTVGLNRGITPRANMELAADGMLSVLNNDDEAITGAPTFTPTLPTQNTEA